MMNNKERAERILAWQLLHNKDFMMTSMAMSVALLLSACGGSSDGDAPAGGKELDLLNYLDPDNPVTVGPDGDDYITFNFVDQITVTGSPELRLEFLLDGDWATVSVEMNTAQLGLQHLSFNDLFNDPDKVTYRGQEVKFKDLPALDDPSDVEVAQQMSSATLELMFPDGASLAIASDPPVMLKTDTALDDDVLIALLVDDSVGSSDSYSGSDKKEGFMSYLDPKEPYSEDNIGDYLNFSYPIELVGEPIVVYSLNLNGSELVATVPVEAEDQDSLMGPYTSLKYQHKGVIYDDLFSVPDILYIRPADVDQASLNMVFAEGESLTIKVPGGAPVVFTGEVSIDPAILGGFEEILGSYLGDPSLVEDIFGMYLGETSEDDSDQESDSVW